MPSVSPDVPGAIAGSVCKSAARALANAASKRLERKQLWPRTAWDTKALPKRRSTRSAWP
eukprot:9360856-Alexandrium_andersonii.AAC.1